MIDLKRSVQLLLFGAMSIGWAVGSTVTTVRSSTYDDGSGSTSTNMLNWVNTSYGTSHTTLSDALKDAFMTDKGAALGTYPNAYSHSNTTISATNWTQTEYPTGTHPTNPYLTGETVVSEAFWGEAKDSGGSTAGGGLLIGIYTRVVQVGGGCGGTTYETRTYSYVERADFNNFDLDIDDLPDEWEAQYGLNYDSSTGVDGKSGDFDGDSLNNYTEYVISTDPSVAGSTTDTNSNGYNDNWEVQYFGGLNASYPSDGDGDGLLIGTEYAIGTDPTVADPSTDTDSDSLEDNWEIQYFGDLDEIGTGNPDSDTYDNETEETNGTDPTVYDAPDPDTDNDNLADAWEMLHFGDLDEIGTGNPDGDSYDNETEETNGTDPLVFDSTNPDSDNDGLLDAWEIQYFGGLSETPTGNPDNDLYDNQTEHANQTDPSQYDPPPLSSLPELVTTVRSSMYDDGSGSTTTNLLNWVNTRYGTSYTVLEEALKFAFMLDKGASLDPYPNVYASTDTVITSTDWNQTNYPTATHPANPYLVGETVVSEAFWGEAKDGAGNVAGGGLLIGLYTETILAGGGCNGPIYQTRTYSYVERSDFNNFDLDGDDLPDEWESQHGLSINDSSGAGGKYGDYDQDGIANYFEYILGLLPSIADDYATYEHAISILSPNLFIEILTPAPSEIILLP
ncbi:MAG: hypothetical protein AAF065_10995 [Verrucomicrobiota bacterium]